MTKEEKELARTYVLAEVAKYIYDNKKRFASEIEAKYGFFPDDSTIATKTASENDNKEEKHDRDNSPDSSPDSDSGGEKK